MPINIRSRRALLLASAMLVSAPVAAQAADLTVSSGQTVTSTVNFGGSDTITVAAGGAITVTGNSSQSALAWSTPATGSGVTINNAGVITGALRAISYSASSGGPITINNSGTIKSTVAIAVGLSNATGPETLTNSGSIIGSDGIAVKLGSGPDTVNVVTGATFTGQVIAQGSSGASWPANIVDNNSSAILTNATGVLNLSGSGSGTFFGSSEEVDTKTGLSQGFAGWDGFSTVNVNSGGWTLVGGGYYSQLNVASGAVLNVCDLASGITCGSFTYNGANGTPTDGGLNHNGFNPNFTIVNTGTINYYSNGSLAANITNNGLFNYYSNGSNLFSSIFSGSGSLIFYGSGLNFLSNGLGAAQGQPSTLTQSTLEIAGGEFIASGTVNANVKIDSGATFQIGSGGVLLTPQGTPVDDGTYGAVNGAIVDNGILNFSRLDDYTLSGALTGSGQLVKNGPGDLTLGGATNFNGHVTLDAGTLTNAGTIAASGSAVITPSSVSGTLAVNNSGVIQSTQGFGLNLSTTSTSAVETVTNSGVIGSGIGVAIAFGSGTNTLNVTTSGTFVGRVVDPTGNGTLNLSGPGSAVVYGESVDPSGGEGLNARRPLSFVGWDGFGTLNVNSGTWTLVGGGYYNQINVASGAAFNVCDVASGATCGSFTYNGANGTPTDGGVNPLNQIVTIVNNGAGALYSNNSGLIEAAVSGTGTLLFGGSGTHFLSNGLGPAAGAPSTLTQSTLEIAGGGFITSGTVNANVKIDAGATFQIGSGGVLKSPQGVTVDNGAYGTVNGAIVDNGTLVIARLDAYTFAGAFSGTGALVDNDPNTVTFSGPYSFTGTTTVNGGGSIAISQLQSNANLNVTSGTLNVTGASSTIANLTVASGTVNVTGASSTIANLNVSSGTVNVTAPSSTITNLSGTGGTVSVASGSTLTVDNGSFGGSITGGGALTVAGTSTATPVVLTGSDTLTGATTVSSGALQVQGSLTSPVTVEAGASLGGTGTITGAVTVASGGVFSPGDPVTTNVNGAVTFAGGSTYFAQVTAGGGSDLIAVNGTVAIQHGASVEVDPLGLATSYARLSPAYTIITATGGVSGTFSSVTSDAPLLTPHLTYSADAVQLYLTRNDISFASLAATPNQAHVAAAAQAAGFGDPVYDALVVQSTAGAQQGYAALSGEIYASLPTVLLNEQRSVSAGVVTRLQTADDADQGRASATGLFHPLQTSSAQNGVAFWGQASTAGLHFSGAGGSAALQDDANTVMVGADMGVHGWRFGLAGGYGEGRIDQGALGSSATVDSTSGALYVGGNLGVLNVKAGADYSWQQVVVERDVAFPGFMTGARGALKDETGEVFGQLSIAFRYRALAIEPYAGASYVHLNEPATVENGGFAALAVSKTSRDVEFASLGLRLTAPYVVSNATTITPYASAGWRQAFGDVGASQTAAFTSSGQGFQITGTPIDRSNATVEMGVEVLATDGLTLALGYQGAYGDRVDQTGVQIRASYRF
jgi:autotransporter-associated beta strand protein